MQTLKIKKDFRGFSSCQGYSERKKLFCMASAAVASGKELRSKNTCSKWHAKCTGCSSPAAVWRGRCSARRTTALQGSPSAWTVRTPARPSPPACSASWNSHWIGAYFGNGQTTKFCYNLKIFAAVRKIRYAQLYETTLSQTIFTKFPNVHLFCKSKIKKNSDDARVGAKCCWRRFFKMGNFETVTY